MRSQQAQPPAKPRTRPTYLVCPSALQQVLPPMPNQLRRLSPSTPSITQHIDTDAHRAKIQTSPANNYIQELSAAYRELPRSKTAKPIPTVQESPAKRSSTRIQEAYHRRKEKDQEVAEVSTMTSQKNQKVEGFERPVRCKTKAIHKIQAQPRRTTKY